MKLLQHAPSPPFANSPSNQASELYSEVVGIKITFQDFKHNYNQHPFSLVVNRQDNYSPVQLLLDYPALRGNGVGAIFITIKGTPVTRALFADLLCHAIKYCGLDPSRNKGHSFSIGAASYAADRGFPMLSLRSVFKGVGNPMHS